MKKTILLTIVLGVSYLSQAQDSVAIQYAEHVSTNILREYLSVLASDSLEGRETGKKGQKMAASYIRSHFEKIGLKKVINDDYFQQFDLSKISTGKSTLTIGGKQYSNGEDFLVYGNLPLSEELATVFVGEGNESDYNGLNVSDKAVVIIVDDIRKMRAKRITAKEKGAKVNILIAGSNKDAFQEFSKKYSRWLGNSSLGFPDSKNRHATIVTYGDLIFPPFKKSNKAIDALVKKVSNATAPPKKNPYRKVKEGELSIEYRVNDEKVGTENILGLVEGSDKKDEIIVVTAHYDHEGIKGEAIYNGADDDGSGTSTVMALAKAFAQAKKEGHGPRRSILFMTVTGEEKGLLGSQYYSENPVFPLEQTITNLNIDMIGRVDSSHSQNENYVYLIGTTMLSMDLHELSETVNKTYTNLNLDYKYNDKNDPNRYYYRSDHYNFAKHNIPVIFYFNGTHKDYHRPTDTIEKINFEVMKERARLVFHTAWELANRDERVALTEDPGK